MRLGGAAMKRISMFLPTRTVPFDVAERHYVEIHHRFACDQFRHSPTVERYVISRARGQYDVLGGFAERPQIWRFVITHSAPTDADRPQQLLPSRVQGTIVADRVNCLRELRSFEVAERTEFDLRRGQTALAKYLFCYEPPSDLDRREARAGLNEHLSTMTEWARSAPGARLLIVSDIEQEFETAAVSEPGQRYTGRFLAESTAVAFVELYFDNDATGEAFFGSEQVRAQLRDPKLGGRGWRVEEQVGVDKR